MGVPKVVNGEMMSGGEVTMVEMEMIGCAKREREDMEKTGLRDKEDNEEEEEEGEEDEEEEVLNLRQAKQLDASNHEPMLKK